MYIGAILSLNDTVIDVIEGGVGERRETQSVCVNVSNRDNLRRNITLSVLSIGVSATSKNDALILLA